MPPPRPSGPSLPAPDDGQQPGGPAVPQARDVTAAEAAAGPAAALHNIDLALDEAESRLDDAPVEINPLTGLPLARQAWLEPWGLLTDSPAVEAIERPAGGDVPAEAAPSDVRLVVTTYDNGVVKALSISSPAIGGTATYAFHEARLAPLAADRPAAPAD